MERKRVSRRRAFRAGRWSWWLIAVPALAMAAYGGAYLVLGERLFPDQVAASFRARPWGIYSHAFFGLFTIAIGPFQFRSSLLRERRRWHRRLGKIYVLAALGTGLSGLYMAVFAYGGWVAQTGFGGMALSMLLTTAIAYRHIRAGQIKAHRAWMVRSYAVMFSAVTFRVWLGVLTGATGGDFPVAYQAAAWLSWVLNLGWAEFYLWRSQRRPGVRRALADLLASQ